MITEPKPIAPQPCRFCGEIVTTLNDGVWICDECLSDSAWVAELQRLIAQRHDSRGFTRVGETFSRPLSEMTEQEAKEKGGG